ncbi:MAG: TonB-dependent receptor plug domain-containing protein [Bacteroidetes bacterium]|nr:TonB-dependent receptor plug domain-containing protein [Bacteroidota bacterium]
MKYLLSFWFIFCFLLIRLAYPQADSISGLIEKDALNANDLVLFADSSRIRIITAGRISTNLEDLPFTVYVITHEDIIRNQYTSLIDVIRSLPGIKTSQPGSGELGESFQIRGLTGNLYTKILINGLPVKPSVVSGMPIGSQLPIRQAERIEVIYGTAAAVYGADAVSGVINIITKRADRGTFVRGDIRLGQDEFNYINFMIGGKAGKDKNILQYSFYGNKTEYNNMNIKYNDQDVYNPLNYYQKQNVKFDIGGTSYEPLELDEVILVQHGMNPDDFKSQYYGKYYEGSLTRPDMEELSSASHMIGLQMEYRGIRFTYDNMYRRTHSSIGLSPVFYKYNNPQNFWGEIIQRTTLSYSEDFGKFSTTSNLSNLTYRMDNNSSQGVTFLSYTDKVYRYSASDDILFEQIFTFSPVKSMEVVAGISYQKSGNLPVTNYLSAPFYKKNYKSFSKLVSTRDTLLGNFGYNPITFSNLSEFLQFYYIVSKFRVMGGIRYDKNTLYGNRLSPQLAVLYKYSKKMAFKFSVGTAYKAPPSSITFQSLAYPVDESSFKYLVVPNKDLLPEKFETFELGINRLIFKKVHFDQSFYFYQITNHIVTKTLPVTTFDLPGVANDSVDTRVNNTESLSRVYGSQTTFRINNLFPSIKLDLELSLTFLNRIDRLPGVKDIVQDYLKLLPKHHGKLKVSFYPVKNLYVHVENVWMSKWMRLLIPFESLYNELFKNIDGYYTMNVVTSYNISNNVQGFVKITNLLDEKYGGLNATILDENLIYNPQLGRSIRFGLSYNLN